MTRETDNAAFIRHVQGRLGLAQDGWAGPATRTAFDALSGFPEAPEAKPGNAAFTGEITERMALEIISHEAIIQEAYKDSVGVWTWSVGITSASGHDVDRYKDNPQPLDKCLGVFIWLLRERYAPAVVAAFRDHPLTEAQFTAALSFHYNTGKIGSASWVRSAKAGDTAKARAQIMEWKRPPEIVPRRTKERDLFFDGKWSFDGKATVYQVRKPSYAPNWSSARRVDVREALKLALGQ